MTRIVSRKHFDHNIDGLRQTTCALTAQVAEQSKLIHLLCEALKFGREEFDASSKRYERLHKMLEERLPEPPHDDSDLTEAMYVAGFGYKSPASTGAVHTITLNNPTFHVQRVGDFAKIQLTANGHDFCLMVDAKQMVYLMPALQQVAFEITQGRKG